MNTWFRRILAVSSLQLAAGCCCLNGPNWLNPGSIPYQQSRATYHDPYPDEDAAPEVAEVRPRSFAQPRAEPVRASAFRDAFGAP